MRYLLHTSYILFFLLCMCPVVAKDNSARSTFDVQHLDSELPYTKENIVKRRLQSGSEWDEVASKAQKAVVQIRAQRTQFNWAQPFKAPDFHEASGSGFFINDKGYLLTNFHVAADETISAYVFMPALGRNQLETEFIGGCPDADVALLKLTDDAVAFVKKELGEIPHLPLGNSDTLSNAQPILAVGFPLGQRYTKKTLGEIAGLDYSESHARSYIHITAPINPGNSGGPSLNRAGEVVGINTAGVKNSQNIAFMVPINDVAILLPELYQKKLVYKPILGIMHNKSTAEHAKQLGNPVPSGVFLNYIGKNTIAQRAGLKPGDMLYEINGFRIDQYGDVKVDWFIADKVNFGQLLVGYPTNSVLDIVLYRNGQRFEKKVTLEAPWLHPVRTIYPNFEKEEVDYELLGGLCFMQLRENHYAHLRDYAFSFSHYFKPEKRRKEVLVVSCILPGSPFDKVDCFNPGLLIKQVNGVKVNNLTQLREALLLSAKSKQVAITTKEKISTVIALDKILQEEPKLAEIYKYPVSKLSLDLRTQSVR